MSTLRPMPCRSCRRRRGVLAPDEDLSRDPDEARRQGERPDDEPAQTLREEARDETDPAGTGNWILKPPGERAPDDSSGSIDGADEATRIAGALTMRGQRVGVRAATSPLTAMAAGAADLPLDLVITVDGATARVKGTVSRAGQIDVAVTGEVADTASLSRLVETDLHIPLPLTASARVRGGGHVYVVDPFDLTAAGQAIDGRVAIKLAAARPAFDLSMASPSLDVARLMPGKSETSGRAQAPSLRRWLFGEEPIPIVGRGLVDARIREWSGRESPAPSC